MTTDQQLRFECLKIAAAIEPREDPRPAAEMLVAYVKEGVKTASDRRPRLVAES